MSMNRKSITLLAITILLVSILGFWLFLPREKTVETVLIKNAPAERLLAVNGRIRPKLQVEIRPIVGGEVIALPFDVGDSVGAGQVLAQIDDAPETAAIEEAEASVQAQKAVLAQAQRDLKRYEALGEFAAKKDVEQRRLAVEEGSRELKRREASVTQARDLRDRRILRAPFSGIILDRPIDPGQTVGLDSILYRLADLTNPEITVEVDEIYAAEIRPGMEALISLPNEAKSITASVVHIEPRVDPATGARDVRLAIRDTQITAPSGLTVTVNLIIERQKSAISIPRSAIIQNGSLAKVRIVSADGIISEQPILFKDWPAETVLVTQGLKAGQRILADPTAGEPHERVKVQASH